MPELPEVETIVRRYRRRLEGRRIVGFTSRWPRNVTPGLRLVRQAVEGRRIARVWRRGKYIVFDLCDASGGVASGGGLVGHLLIHLRMSGRFEWASDQRREPEHVRAHFDLDDRSRLLFCDARKFGRISYAADLAAATAGLGVEPLAPGFTTAVLGRLLRGRRRRLKPLLLDQSVIAGLGNIYADEALHAAGLHPLRRCDRLTADDVRRLRSAIRRVLQKALRYRGTSFDRMYLGGRMQRHLRVYGRAGKPCGRCGTGIRRLRVGQRGTHFCPRCQPLEGGR